MTDWRRPIFRHEGNRVFAHARWEDSEWIDLGEFKCPGNYGDRCHVLGCPVHHSECSWPIQDAMLKFRKLEESVGVKTTF